MLGANLDSWDTILNKAEEVPVLLRFCSNEPPFKDGTSELRWESSDLPKAVWLASKLPAPAPAALGTHALCEQAFVFSEVKSLCVL